MNLFGINNKTDFSRRETTKKKQFLVCFLKGFKEERKFCVFFDLKMLFLEEFACKIKLCMSNNLNLDKHQRIENRGRTSPLFFCMRVGNEIKKRWRGRKEKGRKENKKKRRSKKNNGVSGNRRWDGLV